MKTIMLIAASAIISTTPAEAAPEVKTVIIDSSPNGCMNARRRYAIEAENEKLAGREIYRLEAQGYKVNVIRIAPGSLIGEYGRTSASPDPVYRVAC